MPTNIPKIVRYGSKYNTRRDNGENITNCSEIQSLEPFHAGYGQTGCHYLLRCDAGQFPDHHRHGYQAVLNGRQPGTPLVYDTILAGRQKSTKVRDLQNLRADRQPFGSCNVANSL